MSLSDDFEKEDGGGSSFPIGLMTMGALGTIVVIVLIVVMINGGGNKKKHGTPAPSDETATVSNDTIDVADGDYPIGESTLTSDDLDFWNMYKEDKPEHQKIRDEQGLKYEETEKKIAKEEEEQEKEDDLSEGGTKTEVILPDGTSQWVMVNAYIKKNEYDWVGLVVEEPYVRYYSDGKRVSKQGFVINEDIGQIDFESLKKNGMEYAMVRIARRGYSSGEISREDYAADYILNAQMTGFPVGVSFYSQAITVEEAQEEAQTVIDILGELGYNPKYPVCFDLEAVSNDKSRTANLTKFELTQITKAFCDKIRDAGLTPVIYGNKYWLLRKLDLSQLLTERIWLSQDKDIPDYPYEFDMWEYKYDAKIDGISKKVPLCISFVDYEMR